MTAAVFIFVALIAFVGGWGLSLLWRGLFPRAKVGAPERGRCPSCGKALDYRAGLKCACGNRARSAEDLYRPVRSAKVVLLGLVVVAAAVGLIAALPWLQAWMAWDARGARANLWTAAAWGVAGFGGLLIVRALVGEPSRGRRRCPKCWYDLLIDTRTCSECGFTSEHERAFYRARRRKGPALVGMAVLVLSYGVFVTPRVREGGWVGAIPTAVLIAGYEWWPDSMMMPAPGQAQGWTLWYRIVGDDRLAGWERSWVERRLRGIAFDPRRWRAGRIGGEMRLGLRGLPKQDIADLAFRALQEPISPNVAEAQRAVAEILRFDPSTGVASRRDEWAEPLARALVDRSPIIREAARAIAAVPGKGDALLLEVLLAQMGQWAEQGSLDASDEPLRVVSLIGVLIAREPSFAERAFDARFFTGPRGARRLSGLLLTSSSTAHEPIVAQRILETLSTTEPVSAARISELYLQGGHDRAALERVLLERAKTDPQFAAAIAREYIVPDPQFVALLATLARHPDPIVRGAGIDRLLLLAKLGQGVPTTEALRRVAETLDPDAPDLFPEQREALREFRAMMLSTPPAAPASAQPGDL